MPSQTIQWFPGHMAKTRRMIGENLKNVDAVIDVRDARIPESSANPEIAKICGDKPRLILLNKASLSDSDKNRQWLEKYKNKALPCLLTDCTTGLGIKQVPEELKKICSSRLEKYENKGMSGRRLKIMVLGIPNVGKSSLINRLAGGGKAKVEDRPGVTRDKQWIPASGELNLLDMPGVLWPKFDDRNVAENLAITGAIKDDILDTAEISVIMLKKLRVQYPELLAARYRLDMTDDFGGITDYDLFSLIARKRGLILRGNEINEDRTSAMLLDEFRGGKIGNITLDILK